MIKDIHKISIIGGSGTGKTTLSENLSKNLNIPVYHIDGIHHLKDWKIRDKQERDRIILDLVKKDKWIIDGTYHSTLQKRLEKSDLIIYLDYSTFSQIKGIMGRFFKNHGKEKPEIPGCKEQMNFEFFMFVVKWRKTKRNFIIKILENIDKNKIIIFKTRRKLNKWYKNKFGKKISCEL